MTSLASPPVHAGAPAAARSRAAGPVPAGQDVTTLRMLRRARDRIDRDYAEPIGIPARAAGNWYSFTQRTA